MISRQCPTCGTYLNAVEQFRLCTRPDCAPKAVYDKVMATPRGPLQDTEDELIEWICVEMLKSEGPVERVVGDVKQGTHEAMQETVKLFNELEVWFGNKTNDPPHPAVSPLLQPDVSPAENKLGGGFLHEESAPPDSDTQVPVLESAPVEVKAGTPEPGVADQIDWNVKK